MQQNSDEGAAARATANAIAGSRPENLERSCEAPDADRIVVAPACGGIERIEASFHGNGFTPHRHDTYAIGITLSGIQTFRYRGASRYSMPGNIIVLHPDELHDGGAGTEEGLRYRMMYVPPERLVPAMAGRNRGLPFLSAPVVDDAAMAASLREAIGDLGSEIGELALDDILGQLADGLMRHAGAGSPAVAKPARAAVLRASDYLRENLARQVSSAELEEVAGLDRFALARQFRAVLGTSPHRYLVMRRLDRARAMIALGTGLADAAYAAGFADQAHFSRHFKKVHGMTPGRWAALAGRGRADAAA
ncbi:MAG: AraC family transcriptional regulator [Shinella sp.]|nr:AraC family transcriptional regulator [Shinella sp.]